MRTSIGQPPPPVTDRFPIPMRGNEFFRNWLSRSRRYREKFPIPMRGNEIGCDAPAWKGVQELGVSDPHEG